MSSIAGMKVKVQIKDVAGVSLAGQRGATLNRSASAIDTSTKDGNGWSEAIPGLKSWSIDCDGAYVESDAAYTDVEEAYVGGTTLIAIVTFPSGAKYEGTCIVSDASLEAPYDDLVTYSLSFQGTGALTKTPAV